MLVDYYSRFVEVEVTTKIDSAEVIKRIEVIFARFNLPLSITADNGRQFVSEEYKRYCDVKNIKLISTIPYWPQQNGEVERQNRSTLKALVISQNTGGDWRIELQRYLVAYRSTAHTVTGVSPAKLMFGREMRDKLPCIHQPAEIDEEVRDRDREKKERGKEYGDVRRSAKPSQIDVGDRVLIKWQIKENKLQSTFEPTEYTVVKRTGSEVLVKSLETGKEYRRNVAHVHKLMPTASEVNPGGSSDSHLPTDSSSTDASTANSAIGSPAPSVPPSMIHSDDRERPPKRMGKAPQRFGDFVMNVTPHSSPDKRQFK